MWQRTEHQKIAADVQLVVERLHQLGGKNLGITVGDAGRRKTEDGLGAQADLLGEIGELEGQQGIR